MTQFDIYTLDEVARISPHAVSSASEVHVRNVIRKLRTTIAVRAANHMALINLVLSLNPNSTEIGAGMLAQLQALAREIQQ